MKGSIKNLIGERVITVAFVFDYVEFHFDHPILRLLVLPVLSEPNEEEFVPSQFGYRDKLCELIGDEVVDVEIMNEICVKIRFASGKKIIASSSFEDRPEFLHYVPGKGLPIQVW